MANGTPAETGLNSNKISLCDGLATVERVEMDALLIGCGKMGSALLSQWIKAPATTFAIVDPQMGSAPDGVALYADREQLNGRVFDVIIVAIKPQLVDSVLPGYQKHINAKGVVASIAAGCSIARLKNVFGEVPVIRIMPNLPSEIGKGVSGLFASSDARNQHRSWIETLMQLAGTFVWVESEDGLDRVTAIAGSGPGYVFELARAYVEAATALGFSEDEARSLVLGTLAGTIELAQASKNSLATLRDNVTSKNGTTEAGLNALNGDDALTDLMHAATQAAYARAVEMR